jgi:hypothetical protein
MSHKPQCSAICVASSPAKITLDVWFLRMTDYLLAYAGTL